MESDFERADSFLKRAYNKIREAESHLKQFQYSESVSASQESTELSLKALYLDCGLNFAKTHDLKEEEFLKVLKHVPKGSEHYNYPRLFLLGRFWASFYLFSKYGSDHFKVGADKLFKKGEADLALEHARECYSGCSALHSRLKSEAKK
jgi:HEPN domain-containing protein